MDHIDAHTHLWTLGAPGTEWLAGDGLEPLRRDITARETAAVFDAADVVGSVFVEARSSLDETVDLLAVAEQMARDRGSVHAVVGWVDLGGDVDTQLADLGDHVGAHRLVGVRHQIQGEPDAWFATRAAIGGIEAVLAAGLAFDLVVRHDQLPLVVELVARHPGGVFVLDHLGKPPIAAGGEALEPWRRAIDALAAHDGVVAKLSGLVTEASWASWAPDDLAPVVDHALASFGADRLLHGSDWPVCTLAADHRAVLDTHRALVPTGDHQAVFSANARRTYRLDQL